MLEVLVLRLGPLLIVVAGMLAALPFVALAAFAAFAWMRAGRLRRASDPSKTSLWTDLGYLALSPFTETVSRTLTTLGIVGCALLVGRTAGHAVGPELLDGFGPVARQPRWLIVCEMLVLSDFIYYWMHRLAHTRPCLWRLHAVHHSTQHLRWSSALRAHPAEIYVHLCYALPLFLVGFPVDALAPLAPITTLYALLIHSDLNLCFRRVSYVVNSPIYHRVHHARGIRPSGVNFAGFFPLFDAIFGTYHLPAQRPSELGIDDVDMPETLLAQLRYPFQTRRPARLALQHGPSAAAEQPVARGVLSA